MPGAARSAKPELWRLDDQPVPPEIVPIALTPQQLWTAEKIDTRVQKLVRAGKDDTAIMVALIDHMPTFKQLLDTTQPSDLNELICRLPGFHRYAKILEKLAAGIQSGAVTVPK